MTVLLFIALFGALVLVHEGGHFLAAKRSGVRVEEFGFGFPPRLFARRRGETEYSFNLLPFGGFVRISGEEGEETDEPERSFAAKTLSVKLKILFAGIAMNWVLAAIVLGIIQSIGAPIAVSDDEHFRSAAVTITGVSRDSPAHQAGLSLGDVIVALRQGDDRLEAVERIAPVQEFLRDHAGEEVTLTLRRESHVREVTIVPRLQPPEGQGPIGISLARVARIAHPWYEAWWRGVFAAAAMTVTLGRDIAGIARTLFTEGRVAEGVSGPVGIAALTGEVRTLGALFVLNFLAILSLNLAILNAIPFPALDGGRAATAIIEHLTGRRIPIRALRFVHAVGFAVLIVGVVLLTIRDVRQLL